MRGDKDRHGILPWLCVHKPTTATRRTIGRSDLSHGTDVRWRPRSRPDILRSGSTHSRGPAGRQRPPIGSSRVLGSLQTCGVESPTRWRNSLHSDSLWRGANEQKWRATERSDARGPKSSIVGILRRIRQHATSQDACREAYVTT